MAASVDERRKHVLVGLSRACGIARNLNTSRMYCAKELRIEHLSADGRVVLDLLNAIVPDNATVVRGFGVRIQICVYLLMNIDCAHTRPWRSLNMFPMPAGILSGITPLLTMILLGLYLGPCLSYALNSSVRICQSFYNNIR